MPQASSKVLESPGLWGNSLWHSRATGSLLSVPYCDCTLPGPVPPGWARAGRHRVTEKALRVGGWEQLAGKQVVGGLGTQVPRKVSATATSGRNYEESRRPGVGGD